MAPNRFVRAMQLMSLSPENEKIIHASTSHALPKICIMSIGKSPRANANVQVQFREFVPWERESPKAKYERPLTSGL